jgi:hypothetical protein
MARWWKARSKFASLAPFLRKNGLDRTKVDLVRPRPKDAAGSATACAERRLGSVPGSD